MNAKFCVSWERVNASGYPTSRARWLSLSFDCREDGYPTSRARWLSLSFDCREDGDTLTLSIHFPPTCTDSTRARLVRALPARV